MRDREKEREKQRMKEKKRGHLRVTGMEGKNRNDRDGMWSTIRPCIDRQIMQHQERQVRVF